MLTASVKAGQAFVSAMTQRSQEEIRAAHALAPPPAHLQSAALQHGKDVATKASVFKCERSLCMRWSAGFQPLLEHGPV